MSLNKRFHMNNFGPLDGLLHVYTFVCLKLLRMFIDTGFYISNFFLYQIMPLL